MMCLSMKNSYEIVRELNSIRGDLPKEVIRLEAQKAVPSGTNVLQMALISNNASKGRTRNRRLNACKRNWKK
jgi:hypothetical protein